MSNNKATVISLVAIFCGFAFVACICGVIVWLETPTYQIIYYKNCSAKVRGGDVSKIYFNSVKHAPIYFRHVDWKAASDNDSCKSYFEKNGFEYSHAVGEHCSEESFAAFRQNGELKQASFDRHEGMKLQISKSSEGPWVSLSCTSAELERAFGEPVSTQTYWETKKWH